MQQQPFSKKKLQKRIALVLFTCLAVFGLTWFAAKNWLGHMEDRLIVKREMLIEDARMREGARVITPTDDGGFVVLAGNSACKIDAQNGKVLWVHTPVEPQWTQKNFWQSKALYGLYAIRVRFLCPMEAPFYVVIFGLDHLLALD